MLPMLVKTGQLKKHEIGAIKVLQSVTYIEVAAGGVDRFMTAISPSMKLEKTISVNKLDNVPQMVAEERAQEPEGTKPFKSRKPKPPHRGKGPNKPYAEKSGGKPYAEKSGGPAPSRKKPKKPKKK
jgi:ATP-dependent RNA helicase DeaD